MSAPPSLATPVICGAPSETGDGTVTAALRTPATTQASASVRSSTVTARVAPVPEAAPLRSHVIAPVRVPGSHVSVPPIFGVPVMNGPLPVPVACTVTGADTSVAAPSSTVTAQR